MSSLGVVKSQVVFCNCTVFIPRRLEASLRRATSMFPVLMVTGPRQSGKTTLLQHLREPERRFVSLDDLDLRRLAQDDPNLFLASFPPPLIIDAFQYAPGLLPYTKIAVDELTTRGYVLADRVPAVRAHATRAGVPRGTGGDIQPPRGRRMISGGNRRGESTPRSRQRSALVPSVSRLDYPDHDGLTLTTRGHKWS